MKHVVVGLGLMMAGACNGDTAGDDAEDPGSVVSASSFELLRTCGGGHDGHGGHDGGGARLRRSVGRGAARIADLQADTIGDNARNGLTDTDPDDSGWDFTLPPSATQHTASTSPPNLFGATGLGAWAAVDIGAAGTRALVAALDAGLGIQRNPVVDSAPDFVFGVLMAELADNPGFAELARVRYDAKRAAAGGAVALGTKIRDARHAGHNDGLIPYDLGWLTLGAAALDAAFPGAGYLADADSYAQIVVDDVNGDPPRFDVEDAHEAFYVTGLAWAQVSASWLGDRATLRHVRDLLLQNQRSDGAWGNNADQPEPDLQATAHALQTIALSSHGDRARRAARRGARWLLGQQAASGGWPDAAPIELPLVDAEIVLGLVLSQTASGLDDGLVPEAASSRAAAATPATPRWATPLAL